MWFDLLHLGPLILLVCGMLSFIGEILNLSPFGLSSPSFLFGSPFFKVRIEKEKHDFRRDDQFELTKVEVCVGPLVGNTQRVSCYVNRSFRDVRSLRERP